MTLVLGTTTEISYWWRVTTQIWEVLLIGHAASGWSTSGSSWSIVDTRITSILQTANVAGHNPSRKHLTHADYMYIVLKNNQVLEFLFTTVRVNETLFNYTDSCSFKNCSFFNSSTFGGLLTSVRLLACTQTLFYFFIVLFENIGERARTIVERDKEK